MTKDRLGSSSGGCSFGIFSVTKRSFDGSIRRHGTTSLVHRFLKIPQARGLVVVGLRDDFGGWHNRARLNDESGRNPTITVVVIRIALLSLRPAGMTPIVVAADGAGGGVCLWLAVAVSMCGPGISDRVVLVGDGNNGV